jgi:hypothetical protein
MLMIRPSRCALHDGQHCTGDRKQAEHVRVELGADLGLQSLLPSALIPIPGVVEKNVDEPKTLHGGSDRRLDFVMLGYVKVQSEHPIFRPFTQVLYPCLVASRGNGVGVRWLGRSRSA